MNPFPVADSVKTTPRTDAEADSSMGIGTTSLMNQGRTVKLRAHGAFLVGVQNRSHVRRIDPFYVGRQETDRVGKSFRPAPYGPSDSDDSHCSSFSDSAIRVIFREPVRP